MHQLLSALVVALCLASVPVFTQSTPAARGARPAAAASTSPVNLNSATAAQIASLPGIGPKTADLVIEYRQKNGPFKKIEEIMNVKGVGEKSFLRIKDRITVAAAKNEQ